MRHAHVQMAMRVPCRAMNMAWGMFYLLSFVCS
jgi:hypothetical protein